MGAQSRVVSFEAFRLNGNIRKDMYKSASSKIGSLIHHIRVHHGILELRISRIRAY